jgi:type II secretory pathway pseudopilin PulG
MKSSSRSAFTLIELAAAFAVFALILLAVGAIVQQSSDSWRGGLDSVSASDEGRAFTDEAFRDLTAAVCTSNFPFVVVNNGSGSTASDRLYLISGYRRNDDGTSDLAEVAYFLKNDPRTPGAKILVRRLQNTATNSIRASFRPGGARDTLSKINSLSFWGGTPDEFSSELARNVRAFRVACYDANNNFLPNYDSFSPRTGQLPARVEVTLQILPAETWNRKAVGGAPAGLEDSTVETFSIAVSPTQTAY